MKGERMRSQRFGRKKYLVNNRVQIKYAILTILMLLIYTVLLLSAIFLAPIAIFQSTNLPLNQQAEAASAYLLLHNTIWPWVGALILLFSVVSIFITHRIAGPMFSLNRAIGMIAAGDLKIRIKFRKGDDFAELSGEMNRMAANLELLLCSLDDRLKDMSSRVQTMTREQVVTGGSELVADVDAMRASLAAYRFGEHTERGGGA
jgi:methyl-accepting chemotaxis protein